MGITPSMTSLEKKVLDLANKKYAGLKWGELGCQKDMKHQIPAKLIYKKLEVEHTSFDINGKFGAIKADLSKSLPEKFKSYFDVITDYGTLEHITDQYETFKNIHQISKKKGIAIHVLPLKNNWKNHGLYEYTEKFFVDLSKLCDYSILYLKILDKNEFKQPYNLIAVALIKNQDNSFPSQGQFDKLQIIKTDFKDLTENYERKGLYRILSYAKTYLYILKWKLRLFRI